MEIINKTLFEELKFLFENIKPESNWLPSPSEIKPILEQIEPNKYYSRSDDFYSLRGETTTLINNTSIEIFNHKNFNGNIYEIAEKILFFIENAKFYKLDYEKVLGDYKLLNKEAENLKDEKRTKEARIEELKKSKWPDILGEKGLLKDEIQQIDKRLNQIWEEGAPFRNKRLLWKSVEDFSVDYVIKHFVTYYFDLRDSILTRKAMAVFVWENQIKEIKASSMWNPLNWFSKLFPPTKESRIDGAESDVIAEAYNYKDLSSLEQCVLVLIIILSYNFWKAKVN